MFDNIDLSAFGPTDEDKRAAKQAGLLSLAAALFGTRKGYEGEGIGRGIAGYLGGQAGYLDDVSKRRMQQMQGAGMSMDLQAKQQAFEQQQALQQALSSYQPQQMDPRSGMASLAPTQANAAQLQAAPQPGEYERLNGLASYLESKGLMEPAMKYRAQAEKYAPQYDGTETLMQSGADGKPSPVVVQKFRNRPAITLPGYQPKPDFKEVSDGQRKFFYDPLSQQQAGSFQMQATPDALLSSDTSRRGQDMSAQTTMRGQNLTNSRALEHLQIERTNADPLGMLGLNKTGAVGNSPTANALTQDTHGDEFIKSLPQPVGDQVKALAEGRLAFPAGFALKSPYWQTMISLVSQYDPNFDAVNYGARSSTRKDFTSGKSANSIQALNTVMGHMSDLDSASSALNNTGVPLWNSIANTVGSQVSPDLKGRVNRFNLTRQAVATEMERAYRGSGGNLSDIQAWKQTLDGADSHEAVRAAIQQGISLLGSKMDALGDTYSKGMGTTADGLSLLSPKAQEAYKRLTAAEEKKKKPQGGWSATEVK